MTIRCVMMATALAGTVQAVPLAAQDAAEIAAMRERNDRIQFANYPRDALRRGEEGVVGISVTTDKQGRLRDCVVSVSSGFPTLDRASCDFLIDHARMRPYLAPNGGGIVRHQQGRVVWKLPPGGPRAVAVPAAANNTAALGEKKICRVQTKTGSLVSSQRICLSRNEWRRQYLYAQEETQDMKPHFLPGE
ncbi:energy transducer TonB [Sphingomonas sp.]|uniref:energy transducer TonB n=1 Tax=Sphingomonas sp. TaxID=28214 RepID=UPI0035BC6185